MNSKWPTFKFARRVDKTDADGMAPIVLRVTYNRKSVRLALALECTAEQWDSVREQFTKKYPGHKLTNDALDKITERVKALIDEMMRQPQPFDLKVFAAKYKNTAQKTDLIQYMGTIEKSLKNEGRIGYAVCFRNAAAALRRFTGERKLPFEELTPQKLESFEAFLRADGCEGGGIAVYMRTIKRAVNLAVKRDKLMHKEQYPFEAPLHHGYSLKGLKSEHNPRALSPKNMAALKAFPFDKHPKLAKSVRLWLISYHLWGANWTDMVKWLKSDLKDGRIVYQRSKTRRTTKKKRILAPKVTPAVQELLAAVNDPQSPYLLPVLDPKRTTEAEVWQQTKESLKDVNKDLKEVARLLGFNESLTFYTARHQMASTWHHAGVNVAMTSQALGHSSIAVTEHYLSKFGNEALDDAAELL